MTTTCGNCKYTYIDIDEEPCASCIRMTSKDNWEPIE